MADLKPMLAETLEDTSALVYPLIASPKLDGIRCLIKDGMALSRSLKPIPNKSVQAWAKANAEDLQGMDGELIVGEHDETVFNRTTSGVMKQTGTPDFTFWVFDNWMVPEAPYYMRLKALRAYGDIPKFKLVPSVTVTSEAKLLEFEAQCLERGFEGVMVRSIGGHYKYGRATVKQGSLLKLKQFVDDEAVVIGFEERMHNDNEATTNEVGRTERSSHKANLRPAGDLGALVCRTKAGVEFKIGTGYTAEQRRELWSARKKLLGQLAKFKSFNQGVKVAPRFPVFIGFRHKDDT